MSSTWTPRKDQSYAIPVTRYRKTQHGHVGTGSEIKSKVAPMPELACHTHQYHIFGKRIRKVSSSAGRGHRIVKQFFWIVDYCICQYQDEL